MNNGSSVSLRPFCYTFPSLNTITLCTLGVLIPHLVMLFVTDSYSSLILVACSVLASCCAEAIDKVVVRRKPFDTSMALLQGIVIGMFLPADYPPIAVLLIVLTSLLIAKCVFGGIAGSWMNPVAVTVIVAYCIGSMWFPVFRLPVEQLQTQNTSLLLIQDGVLPIHPFDTTVTAFLNDHVFSLVGTNIPDGYVSLMWDSGSAIPAFRFNLLTLVASIVMFSLRMLNCVVPVCFIVVYATLVKLFCPAMVGGSFASGDMILSLMTSGTLFTAFFVLAWFGTVPLTTVGKIVYGCVAGVAAFLISGYGLSSAGSMFAVFCANIASLFIQLSEQRRTRTRINSNQPIAEKKQE